MTGLPQAFLADRMKSVLLSIAEWGWLLGDDVLASALLDRLLHHAEIVSINGRSYRMRQRMGSDQPRERAADVG